MCTIFYVCDMWVMEDISCSIYNITISHSQNLTQAGGIFGNLDFSFGTVYTLQFYHYFNIHTFQHCQNLDIGKQRNMGCEKNMGV